MNKYWLILSYLLTAASYSFVVAGPPERRSIETTGEYKSAAESTYAIQLDSLRKIAEIAKRNTEDPFTRALESLDTIKLPTFREIIIDENGVIKVRTDTGLVVITPSKIDSILPGEIADTVLGKKQQINSWGKNIVIEEDMRVNSDIQAFGGNITVKGTVNGDVLAVGGDIYISSTGMVKGNAVAIGGKVKKEEGAKVTGTVTQIGMRIPSIVSGSIYRFIQGIILLLILLGLVISGLAVALLPKPLGRITEKLQANPFKSFGVGYIGYFGIFILWILLLVSIIGIPLAVLGMPLALPLLGMVAYSVINLAIGRKFYPRPVSFHAFLYGCLFTTVIPLFLLFVGYFTNSLVLFIVNMALLGCFIFLFLPIGVGAAVLAKFGLPPREKKTEVAQPLTNVPLSP
jgi:hypothetical protein